MSSSFSRSVAGFTLVEVMVTLYLAMLMCLAVFSGLQLVSRLSMQTAVRTEASRLLQAEAERLSSVDYAGFVASSDETITSALKTSFASGSQARFAYPASGTAGRVSFTRRVVDVASTGTSKTLRVEVEWTWQGRSNRLSVPVLRSP